MTQNLYLGADLTPALAAGNAQEFLGGRRRDLRVLQANALPVRAAARGRRRSTADRPDLIGLQEVSRWEPSGPASVASQRGLPEHPAAGAGGAWSALRVAAVSVNAEIGPVPLVTPCGSTTVGACLIAFTDRDVILVNRDTPGLRWWNPEHDNFDAQAVSRRRCRAPSPSPSTGAGPRSTAASGVSGSTCQHPPGVAGFATVQQAQAAELLAGPAFGPGADLVVGDINSAPGGSTVRRTPS